MPALDSAVSSPPLSARSWGLVPAALLSGSAVLLFSLRMPLLGYMVVAIALIAAWFTDRRTLTEGLATDLLLIASGMVIVSTISVAADISWGNFFLMGFVLSSAVVVPYALSRFVFKDRLIRFPWRGGWPWNRIQWGYLFLVLFLGWLILPFYFITSGVYLNWPAVTTPDEIGRLFVGGV